MSLSLIIDDRLGNEIEYLPVCPQRVCTDWMRTGKSLGLELVPVIDCVRSTSVSEIDRLLAELEALRATDPERSEDLDDAIAMIRKYRDQDVVVAWG